MDTVKEVVTKNYRDPEDAQLTCNLRRSGIIQEV